MAFTIKVKRSDRPMVAEFLCPVHGRFQVEVQRDDQGDPPAEVACPVAPEECPDCGGAPDHCPACGAPDSSPHYVADCTRPPRTCSQPSPHVISATRGARVRKVEAVRGGWQKPERKTWLDTRDLGEGQELEEFRDKRAAIRDEERRASLKELIDG